MAEETATDEVARGRSVLLSEILGSALRETALETLKEMLAFKFYKADEDYAGSLKRKCERSKSVLREADPSSKWKRKGPSRPGLGSSSPKGSKPK